MTSSQDKIQLAIAIELELRARGITKEPAKRSSWTKEAGYYFNSETGRPYKPHHDDELRFVYSDEPRRMLAKGGEGGGKSVAGIVKALDRLRRGMNGICGSPDFEHFKRSLWPEMRRWIPWQHVIERQRYRAALGWEPSKPFSLVFNTPFGTRSAMLCGGFEDPSAWEGPNVNWALFDEARRHRTPAMLKVLDGRIRLLGPKGEPPQLWITTTPRKHWLFDYFGPILNDDPLADFKLQTLTIDLLTEDNERAGNLSEGFTRQRAEGLSESEAAVLLRAAWEDEDTTDYFLPSIQLWDNCKIDLPQLHEYEPMVLGIDAGLTNDTFAICGVTYYNPDDNELLRDRVAVRYFQHYEPRGQLLDFDAIELEIKRLVETYNIVCITYDSFALWHMMARLSEIVWCEPFHQGKDREESDKALLDAIVTRKFVHSGQPGLRQHIANANKKTDPLTRKMRIVKRMPSLKIDGVIAASMAHTQIKSLNV